MSISISQTALIDSIVILRKRREQGEDEKVIDPAEG